MVGVNDRLSDKERNKMFDTLLEGIKEGNLDDRDIYYSLKSIVAAIKCAHLQLTFDNNNPFLDDLVPVGFTWMGNDLIIATSYTDKKYIGCKVLSINGVAVDELIKKYSTICSYETDEGSKSSLEDSFLFVSDLAYLGVMKQKDKKVTIAIENSNGEKENIDVKVYGESTGQAVHNYTEIARKPIPELGMTLVVPTLLDELPKLTEKFGDLKDSAKPDVLVSQTLEDYKNGIDSIYQTIVNDK